MHPHINSNNCILPRLLDRHGQDRISSTIHVVMFTKGINKASAYYAPKEKDVPPESELDGYSVRVEAIVVATCVIIEIVC